LKLSGNVQNFSVFKGIVLSLTFADDGLDDSLLLLPLDNNPLTVVS
jgi:hypothetical protein